MPSHIALENIEHQHQHLRTPTSAPATTPTPIPTRGCDISCFAEHQLDAVECAGHARMVRRVILCGGMTKITRNEAWITLQTEIRSLHMQLAIFCMEHQSVELEENLRRALGACSECPYTRPKFWALSRRKQGRLDYIALVCSRLRFITLNTTIWRTR